MIVPVPDRLTAFYWEAARRGELQLLRCDGCGTFRHWPKPMCRACGSMHLSPATVSGRGTVYSWTVAHQAFHPAFADRLPYVIVVVELEEQAGLRVLATLEDVAPEDVTAGMAVEVAFTEVAPDVVLPVFRPARGHVSASGAA